MEFTIRLYCLPFSQQLSYKIGILEWRDWFGCRVCLQAIEQARQTNEVTVQLLSVHEELLNWNPVWLLQHVRDVELNHLNCIVMEYSLKWSIAQSKKEVQVFLPCLLFIHLTLEVFPGGLGCPCLHYLISGLASFIHEEICIQLEDLHSEHFCSSLHIIPSLPCIVKGNLAGNDCLLRSLIILIFGLPCLPQLPDWRVPLPPSSWALSSTWPW